MLNYIFFHEKPFKLFIDFLKLNGLTPQTSTEDECFEVTIPEDMDDGLNDNIEEEYDRLFEMNQDLMENEQQSETNYSMASIDVPLSNGTTSQAMIKPELVNKLMSVLSTQEFSEVIQIIVTAVENPESRSFCQLVREDNILSDIQSLDR